MSDTPLFDATWTALRSPPRGGRHRLDPSVYDRTEEIPVTSPDPTGEPVADSAGEQDHEDPWFYASNEYVDPPSGGGR